MKTDVAVGAARHPVNRKMRLRAWVAVALLVLWSLAAFSGFLLWLAPEGPRSGYAVLLLDLTKREWGVFHFYLSVAASLVTVLHLVIDWRALRACVRYLTSTSRGPGICE